jgi:uncharacterized protein YhaN
VRIREVHLRRFGHFTDERLELVPGTENAGTPGLHVIYGGNQAGKTTTLHAIRYGLYGIPDLRKDPRTYDFLHAKPDLRIGMVIDSATGDQIAFTRRKKMGATCFDIDDVAEAPMLQEKLVELLHGIDRNLFTYKYGIDHDTLRAGGAGLAGDDSELGESLFAAATGIVGVRATLSALAEQIDDLLKAPGRSGKIHDAVKRYNDAKVAAEKARRAGRGWAPKQQEIERAREALDSASNALSAATVEHERALHIRDAIEYVAKRDLLIEQIDELGEVIDSWSVELEDERKLLRSSTPTAEAALVTTMSELRVQAEKHERLEASVDQAVLGAAERVRDLNERIAEYQRAKGDRAMITADLGKAEQSVARACRAVRGEAAPESARDLVPPLPALEAARALLERHPEIYREAEDAAARLRECEGALDAFEREPGADTPTAIDGLDVVRTAAVQSDTVDTARLAQLDQLVQVKTKQLSELAAALPGCTHSSDALRALPVPFEQTLNAFDDRRRDAHAKVEQLREAVAAPIEILSRTEAEIAAKSEGRDLPTFDQLKTLRAERQKLWQRIRGAVWNKDGGDDVAPIDEEGVDEAAVEALEEAIDSADDYADLLTHAGEVVGAIAALEQRRVGIQKELAQRDADLAQASAEFEQLDGDWRTIWAEIDVQPGTVAEMRAWLEALRGVRDLADSIDADAAEALGLRRRVERVRRDLSSALSAVGRPPASESISVEILKTTASELLALADQARDEASKRDVRRRDLETNREKARTREKTATAALDSWQRDWDANAPSIGLVAGSLPEAGRAMLDAVHALDEALRALDAAHSAHEDNSLIVTRFEQEVGELVSSVGGELERRSRGWAPDQVVRQIADAVADCAKASETLTEVAPRIDDLTGSQRKQEDAIGVAAKRLDALMALSGQSSADELDAAATRWRQREALREQLREIERGIVELTKMKFREVVEYLGSTPPEQLPALIARCERSVEAASVDRTEVSEALDGLQRELGELQGAAKPEPHLAEMDDARAEIESLAARYVPLKLQHDLLADYLREKASEHMGPAMKRAGAIFSELTCGAFSGIAQDVNEENEEVLQAVLPDDRPNVDRTGLSTGACDQLYLALRLASIYQHLETDTNEAIPFVVDDILTTFDDERSAATMRVLGELATRTQVLFFTHHQHLVELARTAVPAEVLRVRELG